MTATLVDASTPQCHATTLVNMPGGGLLIAWFGGKEGAADVAIYVAERSASGA